MCLGREPTANCQPISREIPNGTKTHGIVGDEMMHIMTAFPPSNRQTTNKVANEDADQRIDNVVVCDSAMSSVVCCEHDLLPKDA